LSATKSAKAREISRKFKLTACQGHSRSSILVSIESAYATSYSPLAVGLTLYVSSAVFEILMFKARKWLVLPHPSLVWRPAREGALEFPDKTYPTKTRWMELPYGVIA